MTNKVELRPQRVSDAKRFYEILTNPNFTFFARPASLEDEITFLQKNTKRREDNEEYNYAILYDSKVVGGAGIAIDQHREHIGEIEYFVDEAYRGKGIATRAVLLLEYVGFKQLGLCRIQIVMDPDNTASERVAIKAGYQKEGMLRSMIKRDDGMHDAYLYAKVR